MKLTSVAMLAFVLTFAGAAVAQSSLIEKLEAQIVDAFNAKDATKLASLYEDDAVLMPPNAPLVKGRAAIEAHFKALFSGNPGTLKLAPLESRNPGTSGFSAGTYTLTTPGSSMMLTGVGGGARVAAGKYLMVVKLVRGDLKIAYDIP